MIRLSDYRYRCSASARRDWSFSNPQLAIRNSQSAIPSSIRRERRFGDGAHHVGESLPLAMSGEGPGVARQVGLADYAYDAVTLVYNRNAADLMTRHQPQAAFDQVLLITGEDLIAHA